MRNSFSINIGFLVLSIMGLAIIPRLTVQLYPSAKGQTVFVNFEWPNMGAEVLEKEVTSPIEGALSSLRGVREITSESRKGSGRVTITFKKGTDMDAARFEVSSLIRSLHKKLPEGIPLPTVGYNSGSNNNDPLLLVYTIRGEGSSSVLQTYVAQSIVPRLAVLQQVSNVVLNGTPSIEWEVAYQREQLNTVGLTPGNLRSSIVTNNSRCELGAVTIGSGEAKQTIYASLSSPATSRIDASRLIVGRNGNRMISLHDVASMIQTEAEPASYFRVNGLNTVYLNVYATQGTNQVQAARRVQEAVNRLSLSFPTNFSMSVTYNASEHIETEVAKITQRALLVIVILLIFLLFTSRSWRYLFIVTLSLVANIAIGCIFFYVLDVEIHLYSLAGITVSLSMIIDNTIVMADHLRHSGNRKAFLAILAATLTSIGALTVVYLLKEEQRLNLTDFVVVLLVNLGISLGVALFLVPSLMHQFPLITKKNSAYFIRKRRAYRWGNFYGRALHRMERRRWIWLLLAVWGFGFPVFLLPDKIEVKPNKKPSLFVKYYNSTIGDHMYQSDIKPWVNRILGGSWYYFCNYFGHQLDWDDAQTRLWVNISMPDGATLRQMNDLVWEFENYLSQFDQIERFTSSITSIDNSTIEISFKREHERGSFPYELKQELETKAMENGSADFAIYGVGKGFNNALFEGHKNCKVQIRGYNYDMLLDLASRFRDSLLSVQRIQEVVIQTGVSQRGKPRYEYVMGVNNALLSQSGGSLQNLYGNLAHQSPQDTYAGNTSSPNGNTAIMLRPKNKGNISVWEMDNAMLTGHNTAYRLNQIGTLRKERVGGVIRKRNQQYQITVEYDFIGPYELSQLVLKQQLETLNKELPLGFSAWNDTYKGRWDKKEKSQYLFLLLVVAVVFMLCAVLLESLWQPIAVIAMIPFSFIGLFLSFAMFKINFDQGGYAAMVLLCGITVNSALFIINDYNQNRRLYPDKQAIANYLKAFHHKIIPILLTVFSTILGLIPFLTDGAKEGFWFTLAFGTIGGLLFSILGVVIWLPLIILKKKLPVYLLNKQKDSLPTSNQ
ncbi:MAG: efflux RND transporter permease subunit [Breznakibacter sp.]